MKCRLHNQPRRRVCARCADLICSMCAEYIEGSWFCPDCAAEERRIAAGQSYRRFAADIADQPDCHEEIPEFETAEV